MKLRNVPALLAVCWIALVVLAAVCAPILPLQEAENAANTLGAPVMAPPDVFSAHPLGTNELGLDVLARLVYGARASLTISFVAVLFGLAVGGVVGMVAGFWRGPVDTVVDVVVNAVLAFPALVLLIVASAVLPRSVLSSTILFGILSVPFVIRLARASTIAIAQQDFVVAARSYGAGGFRVLRKEIFPSVALTLSTYGLIIVAVLMVAEASVSFLGLGLPAPKPSWGAMIAEGQNGVFEQDPWIVLIPSTVLFLTVLSLNVLGYRVRRKYAGVASA